MWKVWSVFLVAITFASVALSCQQSGSDRGDSMSGEPVGGAGQVANDGGLPEASVDWPQFPLGLLNLANGESVAIGDLRPTNNAVLLYFFATW